MTTSRFRTLILASESPRRKDLLARAGFFFHVFSVKVSENLEKNLTVDEQILAIARRKAEASLRSYKTLKSEPFLMLAADTMVILGGEPLGKPSGPDQAFDYLSRLSGKVHEVKTAVVLVEGPVAGDVTLENLRMRQPDSGLSSASGLIAASGSSSGSVANTGSSSGLKSNSGSGSGRGSVDAASEFSYVEAIETTQVFFRHLSEREIREYIQTGEPLDKAGAYGIQGLGGNFVEKIIGTFDNVVGLPMEVVHRLIRKGQWQVKIEK
jgi:predicted house-cleaning NTP pyrophosphatase (Maf/HAM1 superfamily)